jgi:hypothetical protein
VSKNSCSKSGHSGANGDSASTGRSTQWRNCLRADAKSALKFDEQRGALPIFSEQRVPDARALRKLSDYAFPRQKWLIAEYYLRLQLHRVLHQWFPQLVQPFIFDLVMDYDLPYSQILSFHQGWIDRVKRSNLRGCLKSPSKSKICKPSNHDPYHGDINKSL